MMNKKIKSNVNTNNNEKLIRSISEKSVFNTVKISCDDLNKSQQYTKKLQFNLDIKTQNLEICERLLKDCNTELNNLKQKINKLEKNN